MNKFLLRGVSAIAMAMSLVASVPASAGVAINSMSGGTISITGDGDSSTVIINGTVVSDSSLTQDRSPLRTERRDLQAFNVVELDAPADATFTISPTSSISITGPSNSLAKVTTSVHNGRLKVAINGTAALASPLRLRISGPSLSGVRILGSGTMSLDLPSGDDLDLRISGSGSIKSMGSVSSLRIILSGSGVVNAGSMRSKSVDVQLSGSGEIRALATERADIDLSGSGTISIGGKPAVRNVDRSGAGEVTFE